MDRKMIENIENNGDTLVTKKKYNPINGTVEYREDGCLQPTSPSISLTDDHEIIDLDGYHVSVADLKEHIIDSYMYRKHLQEIKQEAEIGGDSK